MQEYLVEKNGVRRKAEQYSCEVCGEKFLRRLKPSKGNEKKRFCSQKCAHEFRSTRVEVECFQCGTKFKRAQSRIIKNKHNCNFCSRKCKDYAQSLSGNCVDIRPSHYGNGERSYNERAFRDFPNECCECKEKRKYMLSVHHKDGDRENPSLENLEIVCYNCHSKRHLKLTSEGWVFDNKSLTPREKLLEV